MEEKDKQQKYALDIVSAFAQNTIKKLWIVIIILIILLFGTNAAWIIYESQFEVIETEVTQTNDRGFNNFIGNDGDIIYGYADDQDEAEG